MSIDRRATIEAALNEEEVAEGQTAESNPPVTPSPAPAPRESAPSQDGNAPPVAERDDPGTTPAPGGAPAPVDESVSPLGDKTYATDKPPQSWRPAQKAKWAALDPEVRQEVIRRERDMERTLGDTAQARQVAQQFHQTVSPYMARIQSLGVPPMTAITELLKADHLLTTAPKTQRAAFMAKMIKDYGVDVQELDAALAGQPTTDPVEEKVSAMLKQRMAPYEQFMAQRQSELQQAQQAQQEKVASTLAEMQANVEKYPDFESLRGDMADIIDLQAKKGVYVSLDQAYNRAVAMNPEVSQRVADLNKSRSQTQAARDANTRAQRAKAAAKSVGGAPIGGTAGAPVVNDRRATIAAALDQAEGR